MNSPKSTGHFNEELAACREQLEQLRSLERELKALEQAEVELEVEKISADVALQSATAKTDFGIEPKYAVEIADALAHRQRLKRAMVPPDDGKAGSHMNPEQLRAGTEALNDWLGAAATAANWRRVRGAYAFIGVTCILTIGAAVMVHIMLLVLLVPLMMALGYLAFTERDADWIRLGAVRRFGQTMLPPPTSWEKSAVESCLSELEAGLAEADSRRAEANRETDRDAKDPESEDTSEIALAMGLIDANDRLDAACRKFEIDPASIDEEFSNWLQQIHDVRRIGDELAETRTKRKSLKGFTEENRDAIFRFLALSDAAPIGGRADLDSLDAGLQSLSERNKRS